MAYAWVTKSPKLLLTRLGNIAVRSQTGLVATWIPPGAHFTNVTCPMLFQGCRCPDKRLNRSREAGPYDTGIDGTERKTSFEELSVPSFRLVRA
jgi:hypothetical protein